MSFFHAGVITRLINLKREELPSEFERDFKTYEIEISVLVMLDREFLSDVVRKPEFRVIGSRRVPAEGGELVEIEFDYLYKTGQTGSSSQKGTLVVDPQRYWCVRSYTINTPQRTNRFEVSELTETQGSLPLPKRAMRTTDYLSTDGTRDKGEFFYEYDLHELRQPPGDDEFTLTAFGLPEPPGLGWKRPTPWYLWLGLAGIAFLLLGVSLRQLSRRRSANT